LEAKSDDQKAVDNNKEVTDCKNTPEQTEGQETKVEKEGEDKDKQELVKGTEVDTDTRFKDSTFGNIYKGQYVWHESPAGLKTVYKVEDIVVEIQTINEVVEVPVEAPVEAPKSGTKEEEKVAESEENVEETKETMTVVVENKL
jgi:hypothetical protein